MRSKKVLLIILAIAAVIFIVSMAIGQPVWQALVFSIVFLLIAALVSSSGLLIPEGLFEMRLPERFSARKSTEPPSKDEFLKRVESALADSPTKRGAKIEDVQWMTEYTRVVKGVGELAYEVHESVRSKDRAKELQAFKEAVKQLPHLIIEFENIPEPTTPKRQKTMERQARGLDLYLLGCSNFAEAFETSNGDLAGLAAKQISEALDLLDLMDKFSTTPGRR